MNFKDLLFGAFIQILLERLLKWVWKKARPFIRKRVKTLLRKLISKLQKFEKKL